MDAVGIDASAPPIDAGIATPKRRVKKKCVADRQHCCRKDGTLDVVSGCDPMGAGRGVERRPDGTCSQEFFCLCLPNDARIATPAGSRRVSELAVGDLVWTADADGARVAVPIIVHGSVPLATEHPIVEVALADGRTLRASPGHPLVDGTLVGKLRKGDPIDGSTVRAVTTHLELGPTWDLLPAGPTGTYWSDGVRIGSTLVQVR